MVCVDPSANDVTQFLDTYVLPETSLRRVHFFKAYYNAGMELAMQPVPEPNSEEPNG